MTSHNKSDIISQLESLYQLIEGRPMINTANNEGSIIMENVHLENYPLGNLKDFEGEMKNVKAARDHARLSKLKIYITDLILLIETGIENNEDDILERLLQLATDPRSNNQIRKIATDLPIDGIIISLIESDVFRLDRVYLTNQQIRSIIQNPPTVAIIIAILISLRLEEDRNIKELILESKDLITEHQQNHNITASTFLKNIFGLSIVELSVHNTQEEWNSYLDYLEKIANSIGNDLPQTSLPHFFEQIYSTALIRVTSAYELSKGRNWFRYIEKRAFNTANNLQNRTIRAFFIHMYQMTLAGFTDSYDHNENGGWFQEINNKIWEFAVGPIAGPEGLFLVQVYAGAIKHFTESSRPDQDLEWLKKLDQTLATHARKPHELTERDFLSQVYARSILMVVNEYPVTKDQWLDPLFDQFFSAKTLELNIQFWKTYFDLYHRGPVG